jgi:phosphoglycerate dehydrogenase-like enzyme
VLHVLNHVARRPGLQSRECGAARQAWKSPRHLTHYTSNLQSDSHPSPPITLLVIGDPAANYLKPLAALPDETRVLVSRDRDRLKESAAEADVILNADFQDPTLLTGTFPHATRVRWIHSLMAGVDKVLSPEIVASPVPMTNGRGLYGRSLAEWTIGAMAYFAFDFRRLLRQQAVGKWESFDHPTLFGRTLGIVGYGAIGRAIAERARPFGIRVVTLRRTLGSRTVGDADPLVDRAYSSAQLNEMLAECDYVVVTAPLTAETRGLLGVAQIAAMKPTAVLINVGRGAVIDEGALLAALESGKLRGAALDVFTTEPLPASHPFYRMENVLLSPHTADRSPESRTRAVDFFLKNFERFRIGEPLENIVNKHAGY